MAVEIHYCWPECRNQIIRELRAAVPDVRIEWLCIENDLQKANKNCLERPKGDPDRHIEINSRLSPRYTYPDGAKILKMWTKGA